ncbi:MAG: HAD family hydrolase [bacterium]|jgi:hypothetical protein|nr:HAD family hydrolase [Betaproteobacteria bacterium]
MRIGLDFDNTIVSYDALFHRVALDQGEIPASLPANKVAVRDHLRKAGREPVWTEMQGTVYGARMDEAAAYPGVVDCLRWLRSRGIPVAIMSHKTRHPFLGPAYDLHAAAVAWIAHHLVDADGPLVDPAHVHFEVTKEGKLDRVGEWGATHFVDDLPEILLHPAFPRDAQPLLFDRDGHHAALDALPAVSSWAALQQYLEAAWTPGR